MKAILSRRSLLAGAGYATAYGVLAGRLLSLAEAQEAAPAAAAAPQLCLSMVFPNGAKSKFDARRYAEKHMPLLRQVYGDSVARIELRTAQSPSPGMPPSLAAATTHVWINDVRAFSQKLAAAAQDINTDLDATSKGPRVSQIDRLAASVGDGPDAVQVGTQVFTTFYPLQDGKTLDQDYYRETHIPKLYSLFGATALRRVEGTLGMDQGGTKATYVATTHLFIRDRSAYDTAMKTALGDMVSDAKKYTTIAPFPAELRVAAIG